MTQSENAARHVDFSVDAYDDHSAYDAGGGDERAPSGPGDAKDPEARDRLFALIDDIAVAMVTTLQADGSMRARPMAAQRLPGDEERVFLLTSRSSHKIEEIAARPQVNLSFAKGGEFVSISGTAEIHTRRDLIETLWTEEQRPWFPGGVDDPEIAALVVTLDYGEYWDRPSPSKVIAYGWAEALLTGESQEGAMGENAKVGEAP